MRWDFDLGYTICYTTSMSTTKITTQQAQQEHDVVTAELYHELDKALQYRDFTESTIRRMAGQQRRYMGRTASSQAWVVTRNGQTERATFEEALAAVEARDPSERDLSISKTVAQALNELRGAKSGIIQIRDDIKAMADRYTGWSRFFLVTSSSGHIHSSMHCSSCRPTTSFGWMPQLSGQTEAQAVEACGPTLCSICFPEAPLDWRSGNKISKAKAAKLVA